MVTNPLRTDPFTGTVLAMVLAPVGQHGAMFRAGKTGRLTLIGRGGTGRVMAGKWLEEHAFTWSAAKNGVLLVNHAPFEALSARLDGRRVRASKATAPAAVQ